MGIVTDKQFVHFREGGKTLATQEVGEPAPPPARSWMRVQEPHAVAGAGGAFVWHFGYASGRPRVTLLHGGTLAVLGHHDPLRPPFYNEGDTPQPLDDWGEDFTLDVTGDPSVALFFANVGDDALMLHTLVATPEGIQNPAGLALSQAARIVPDARLFDAAMVWPDRLVMLGDINDLYLLSWPEGERLHTRHLKVPGRSVCTELLVQDSCLEVHFEARSPYDDDNEDLFGQYDLDLQTLEILAKRA